MTPDLFVIFGLAVCAIVFLINGIRHAIAEYSARAGVRRAIRAACWRWK